MRSVSPLLLVVFAGCGGSEGAYSDGSFSGSPSSLPAAEQQPEAEPEQAECDADTPVTLYVSPDDSNSMSSPVQARVSVVGEGLGGLRQIPIRTWEFLNYTSWDYAPAEPGELTVDLQLAQAANPENYVFQVGITSESPTERAPMNVAFVVDASGSMEGEPLALAKDVMRTVSDQLVTGDVVSVVTWDTVNNVLLDGHVVGGPSDPVVDGAIDRIQAGGATNLANGLAAGYRLADENFDPTRINRILLISDGGANVGQTDEEVIGTHAGGEDDEGIYLVGVGVGSAATYNDLLMDVVTDLGRGASVFVPTTGEAERMFGERFLETMGVAARDVEIRYDLPAGFEVVRFSGEEISTDPEEVRSQHVAPADSVVLHQTLRSCGGAAPEEATLTVTVDWRDAVTFEPRQVTRTATIAELLGADHAMLAKGAAVFAYAEALKTLQAGQGDVTLADALEAWETAADLNPGDSDLAEIRTVLDAL